MKIQMPPKWFNAHGLKMFLSRDHIVQDTQPWEVLIGNEVARIQIRHTSNFEAYKIFWSILLGFRQYVEGELRLSEAELKDAFNLGRGRNITNELALDFLSEFDGDAGVQGHYIRKGQFLNVPMPGTGLGGDPNVSVYVSEEIQKAVRKLIET